MRIFYNILTNSLIASVSNNFIWFALTFWAYLETKSVISTSIISGVYLTINASTGFWLGSIVDHHLKKNAMLLSSFCSLIAYVLGYLLLISYPEEVFHTINSFPYWSLIIILLLGVIAGNIRSIALPTLVTILLSDEQRDKANGMVGSMTGTSFALTSVFSGITLARLGLQGVLLIAIFMTIITLIHLFNLQFNEKLTKHSQENPRKLDIKGTIKSILSVPGLFALILFTTLNNLLGGVFMSLMDAYGLSLVSVEVWGVLLSVLSFGFIAGGLFIAKKGLGVNPLKTLFIANIIMWLTCIFFTIQPWIILLISGMFVWMSLSPFVEAIEQTIIQKVVPLERQGRVFGFAHSVEQAASPLTAFIIGPLAQYIFIPYMTTGAGVQLIGNWFGVGEGRGIALVFTVTGVIGLIITLFAMKSKFYKLLSKSYLEN